MQFPQRSSQDCYHAFIEFIRSDIQGERRAVNRRMMGVFFWCFLLPAIVFTLLMLLIQFGVLPRSFKRLLDSIFLLFPVSYAVYFLSSQVLLEVPKAFKRGGMAITLGQSLKESQWREQVCKTMKNDLKFDSRQWEWIVTSFSIDLERLQNRTRYITALAGAVFYLLMQGIDSLTEEPSQKVTWVKDSLLGWIDTTSSSNLSQFVGLTLFLVLLYLSGSQTYHYLQRYLNCAQLLSLENRHQLHKD